MHRKTKYFLTFLILFLACHLSLSAKSFEVRAVYLDFRTQVMTMPAMKEFVADAASKGMNAVVVEWEATFPFKDNLVLRNRFAFSEAEVKDFIAYCSGLGVDVIPLQNCFGHSEYILRHERYAVLKEDRKDCSQVCPMMEDEAGRNIQKHLLRDSANAHIRIYSHRMRRDKVAGSLPQVSGESQEQKESPDCTLTMSQGCAGLYLHWARDP